MNPSTIVESVFAPDSYTVSEVLIKDYIENKERLRQLRDEAMIRQFWTFKSAERLL